MSEPMTIFLVGQAIVLLTAIIGTHVRTSNKITLLSAEVANLKERREEARKEVDELAKTVSGISRVVARHEAIIALSFRPGTAGAAPAIPAPAAGS